MVQEDTLRLVVSNIGRDKNIIWVDEVFAAYEGVKTVSLAVTPGGTLKAFVEFPSKEVSNRAVAELNHKPPHYLEIDHHHFKNDSLSDSTLLDSSRTMVKPTNQEDPVSDDKSEQVVTPITNNELMKSAFVSPFGVQKRQKELSFIRKHVSDELPWLIQALTVLDLTTLAGDDTPVHVEKLCRKAAHPLSRRDTEGWIDGLHLTRVAAVCVFPSRVADAVRYLKNNSITDIKVASVATGFPTGQYPLSSKLLEIKYAVEEGATEIDVVISRALVLTGQWNNLFYEISEMKKACGKAHMKTILATGECDSYENIYKASIVAALAGSDFIKTSTGKEAVNATLPVGIVMCRAIRTFYEMTGKKVGFKPAGGIKTGSDAIDWLSLIKCELGDEWLDPSLFRIGASSVLDDLVSCILKHKPKKEPKTRQMKSEEVIVF